MATLAGVIKKKAVTDPVSEIRELPFSLGGSRDLLAFEFQLCGDAVLGGDVLAFTEIDRLVDAAAFPESKEVADLTDLPDCWDPVVRWDGDISCWYDASAVFRVQAEGDAALVVVTCDDPLAAAAAESLKHGVFLLYFHVEVHGAVAFCGLLADELVVNLGRFCECDNVLGLPAGGEGAPAMVTVARDSASSWSPSVSKSVSCILNPGSSLCDEAGVLAVNL